MCGIAGIVSLAGGPIEEARLRSAWRGRSRTGARCGGRLGRRAAAPSVGLAPPPAVDHRPRDRRPADGERGRHACRSSSTARSTTSPSSRGRSRPRPPLPHAVRHRGDRPRLRGLGRRGRRAARRHVRASRSGTSGGGGSSSPATAPARSRSSSDRDADGSSSRPRSRRCWRPGRRREPRPGRAAASTSPTATCRRRGRFYRGIQKLPPASCLAVEADGTSARGRAYWDLDFRPQAVPRVGLDAAATVRTALGDAVARRLVADVPLGAFCSRAASTRRSSSA